MDVYIGTIMAFAFGYAPVGWLACAGQTLAISQYQALFALIGVTYGGNGTTNFMLPNLQGRYPVGQGTGLGLNPITMGQVGGAQNATLLPGNIPAHNHSVAQPINTSNGTSSSPANGVPAGLVSSTGRTDVISGYASSASGGTAAPFSTGITGAGQPFSIQNPFLGLSYCIAVQGLFPPRP